MAQNLTLVSLEDLEVLLAKKSIKNEVWSAKQASKFLNCSDTQVKKLANSGEVPGVKLGGDWKFSSIALFELVYGKELSK